MSTSKNLINKKFYFDSKIINKYLRNKSGVLLISFLSQGFFRLNIYEKIFKIIFELFFFLFFFIVLSLVLDDLLFLILLSSVFSHFFNWFLNDHCIDNLCHLGFIKNSQVKTNNFVAFLKAQIENKRYIHFAGIYGSLARGERIRPTSDIDLRIISAPGKRNIILANILAIKIRVYAALKLFPLDLYVWNEMRDLSVMRSDEKPIILRFVRGDTQ